MTTKIISRHYQMSPRETKSPQLRRTQPWLAMAVKSFDAMPVKLAQEFYPAGFQGKLFTGKYKTT